jgi:hypothetical protein
MEAVSGTREHPQQDETTRPSTLSPRGRRIPLKSTLRDETDIHTTSIRIRTSEGSTASPIRTAEALIVMAGDSHLSRYDSPRVAVRNG